MLYSHKKGFLLTSSNGAFSLSADKPSSPLSKQNQHLNTFYCIYQGKVRISSFIMYRSCIVPCFCPLTHLDVVFTKKGFIAQRPHYDAGKFLSLSTILSILSTKAASQSGLFVSINDMSTPSRLPPKAVMGLKSASSIT